MITKALEANHLETLMGEVLESQEALTNQVLMMTSSSEFPSVKAKPAILRKHCTDTESAGLEAGFCYFSAGSPLTLSEPDITQKQNGHTHTHLPARLGSL